MASKKEKKAEKEAGGMKKMDEATYAKWNKSDPGPKAAVTRYWGKYGPMFVDALKELGGEIDYAKMKEFVAKHGEKYGVASHSADTLQRQLYAFTVNHEGRVHYGQNKKARGYDSKKDILFGIVPTTASGGGKYVSYEPSKHGEWRIIIKDGKPQIDKVGVSQSDKQETGFDFETLKKLFHKHFRMSNRNYREVAVRTLLDAADLTDVKGKQIKENIKKLNSILPPELQGQNDVGVALEMCREPQGERVGIEYNRKKDSYSLALSKDATEEQKKELKGICGRYIAKLHLQLVSVIPMQNPSGNEIKTLEEFKSITSEGEGFIAITDKANPDRIHSATCSRLREDWFVEKMVTNKGKSGLYLWYPSSAAAQKANPDALGCAKCDEIIKKIKAKEGRSND